MPGNTGRPSWRSTRIRSRRSRPPSRTTCSRSSNNWSGTRTRLRAAFDVTNRSPLGACAITGTGFPIDRGLTSRLLGFGEPTGNTYGSIATVDYLLQNVTAAAVLLAGLGRFVQDMLLWCTAEFAYMRLGDGFVQGSSIMPQKRNPVALEHARAIGSRALGEAMGVVLAVHNTPFGDIVDTEDDLQPLVERMFCDATRAIDLVSAAMASAEFNAAILERRAGEGWITITELADTLVRDHGLSFGAAHGVARRVVEARTKDPSALLSARGGGSRRPACPAVRSSATNRRCRPRSARDGSSRSERRTAARRPRRRRGRLAYPGRCWTKTAGGWTGPASPWSRRPPS